MQPRSLILLSIQVLKYTCSIGPFQLTFACVTDTLTGYAFD
uniref:Uncharacterized protein n=1 Tax=Rhizophora mucronata TaxID=61149 RepID=A0A2P2QHN4_RHIMU